MPEGTLHYLDRATRFLTRDAIDTPRLDAEVLLAHVLDVKRIDLYAKFDRPLDPTEVDRYRALITRRAKGEPVAYITGERGFYSRSFAVDPAVLIPRPETEHLVEAALDRLPEASEDLVIDVGVGSGCIAITLLAERPALRAIGIDASRAALTVAARNAERHGVADRLMLVHGNRLEAIHHDRDVKPAMIVSNPPYIPPEEKPTLPIDVRDHEPAIALFSPGVGTVMHAAIARGATRLLAQGGALLLEVGAGQHERVRSILSPTFDESIDVVDLGGHHRVVGGLRL